MADFIAFKCWNQSLMGESNLAPCLVFCDFPLDGGSFPFIFFNQLIKVVICVRNHPDKKSIWKRFIYSNHP